MWFPFRLYSDETYLPSFWCNCFTCHSVTGSCTCFKYDFRHASRAVIIYSKVSTVCCICVPSLYLYLTGSELISARHVKIDFLNTHVITFFTVLLSKRFSILVTNFNSSPQISVCSLGNNNDSNNNNILLQSCKNIT